MKILTIGNNFEYANELSILLRKIFPEAELLFETNGFKGTEWVKQQNADVILYPIDLAEKEGYFLCLQLKNDEQFKDIPLILLTQSNEDRLIMVRAMEAGADGFITMPTDEIALKVQILSLVKMKDALLSYKKEKEIHDEMAMQSEKNKSELIARNLFIQTLLDNLPIGIALNTIDEGVVTYMNKRFQEIYGWNSGEMTSVKDFFEKVFPDAEYKIRMQDRIMTDISTGDPSRMHWDAILVTGKDGRKRIVNAVNIPLTEQNTMVSTVMDITELKNIELELKEAYDLLSEFISKSPIYAYIKEVSPNESRVIKASENFVEMIGLRGSDMEGKTMEELFPQPFAKKITKDDWEVASTQKMVMNEEELNGRYYTTYKFPVKEGNRVLLAGYTIDITEQKRINEELVWAKERAEESDRLKTAFLANMSHEIRTPMNSIMGFASLLPDEESRELMVQYARIIVQNSEQLVHIIDDIVTYSRLQAGLISCFPRSFEASTLLEDLRITYDRPDMIGNLKMNLEIHSKGPILLCSDYEKLKQVFVNLISNAIKYTRHGFITLGYTVRESEIVFFIKDSGIGIHADELGKVFERFYRGRNVSKGIIGGTGLGLPIAKELMSVLNGKIWVDSQIGIGTTFYFSIKR